MSLNIAQSLKCCWVVGIRLSANTVASKMDIGSNTNWCEALLIFNIFFPCIFHFLLFFFLIFFLSPWTPVDIINLVWFSGELDRHDMAISTWKRLHGGGHFEGLQNGRGNANFTQYAYSLHGLVLSSLANYQAYQNCDTFLYHIWAYYSNLVRQIAPNIASSKAPKRMAIQS